MSVIAWDGKTLAADRMVVIGDTIYTGRKLWPLEEGGGALAEVGNADCGASMVRWWKEGAKREEFPESQKGDKWATLIVALPGRPVFYYEKTPEPIESRDDFSAWGCGREAALGALALGASAQKAVEVASQFILYCGRGCDFVRVNP